MQPFGRNRYGTKIGEGCAPLGEGELTHLDPSNRLATVHERCRQTDRQTGRQTDRQVSDSIGRTVLQTVAQKLINQSVTFRQRAPYEKDKNRNIHNNKKEKEERESVCVCVILLPSHRVFSDEQIRDVVHTCTSTLCYA